MAKDPAFLFYTGDFTTGTQFLTDEQLGKYLRLLMAQHQHGHLSEKQMILICKVYDEEIFSKFTKDDKGLFFNERLQVEIEKRQSFSKSRASNRGKGDNENVHIYVMYDFVEKLYKIGSSVSPQRRELELAKSHPGVKLLFYCEKTSQKLETELHQKYKHRKSYNEWFDLFKSDIDDIINHMIKHTSNHIIHHMSNHMENENENENKDIIRTELETEKNFIIQEMISESNEVEIYQTFEDFWNEYDKKRGDKEKIKKKWEKLKQSEKESIMEYIPNYKLSQPDKQYRKDPETFLNNKSWNDEIITDNGKQNNKNIGTSAPGKIQTAYLQGEEIRRRNELRFGNNGTNHNG